MMIFWFVAPRSPLDRKDPGRFEEATSQLWRWGTRYRDRPTRGARPTNGAAREYVDNDTWQTRVADWLQESSRVVIVIGTTEGVAWEFERVGHAGQGGKLVVAIPPVPDEEVRDRWSRCETSLRKVLNLDCYREGFLNGAMFIVASPKGDTVIAARTRSQAAYDAAGLVMGIVAASDPYW